MEKSYWFLIFLGIIGLSGCLKNDNVEIDTGKQIQEQYTKDSILMSQFILDEAIDTSGVRAGVLYQIIEPGTGNHVYTANSKVTVKYQGRLLNGTVFDETEETARIFTLGELIGGWQIGLQLIQPGGKIRLIVPSYYGYGTTPKADIPANSVLDFDIELIEVE